MSQTKRLFLAVDLDDNTRNQAGEIAARLRATSSGLGRATWSKPATFHLTLFFFAEADGPLEDRIRQALATPLALSPFDLRFEGVGCFPNCKAPRVLWLGVAQGGAELSRLRGILGQRLGPHPAIEPGFSPHLTLARLRDRVTSPEIGRFPAENASAGPTRIERVTLYESHLSPSGPVHTPRAEVRLS